MMPCSGPQEGTYMIAPKGVKVGPIYYEIVLSDGMLLPYANHLGLTDNTKCKVNLSTEQAPCVLRDTLLHETLHAIWSTFGIGGNEEEEEALIRRITPALLGVLRDNPELVEFLTGPDSRGNVEPSS